MKEIDRRIFASLNVDDGIYYVLVDGYFRSKFVAESDTEAIKKFQSMVL